MAECDCNYTLFEPWHLKENKMNFKTTLLLLASMALFLAHCGKSTNPETLSPESNTPPRDGSAKLAIVSLEATPSIVPAGNSALVKCTTHGGIGKLTYDWSAMGAVGSIDPLDTACVFSSPSCHEGLATVTVTVTDGSGARVSQSVNLNE